MKIIINNLAIEYSDVGQGPIVLFLHGWKDTSGTFRPLIEAMGHDWRFVSVDMPGFGGSELPRAAWTLADYVDFVASFIHKLSIDVDLIVGHSMGGRIIIKGLATEKLHADRAVLIGAAGIAKTNTARNQMFKIVAKAGKAATAIPPFSLLRHGLRRRLYRASGSDYLSAGPLAQTFLNLIREDLQSMASQIQIPVLLVWGAHDAQTPVSDGRKLKSLIAHSNLLVIDDADHFVHHSHAREIAAAIRDFSK